MKRTRILLADDHVLISAAFRRLLEPEFEVVGSVADGRALVKVAVELKPDIAVVDVGMPLLNGLAAARELKKLVPAMKFVFLTMNSDPDIACEAIQLGASGFLLKNSGSDELLKAVNCAIQGTSYVTPKVARAIEQRLIRNPTTVYEPRRLSDRQREVLQMLAEGQSMKEIAYELEISLRTVRFHKYRIMEELEITTDAGLVQYAIKHAIIFPQ